MAMRTGRLAVRLARPTHPHFMWAYIAWPAAVHQPA